MNMTPKMKKVAIMAGAGVALVALGAFVYTSMKKSDVPVPDKKEEPQEQKEEEIVAPTEDDEGLPFVPKKVMSASKRR